MFARRSNPSIDKPIVRKKMLYLEEQVRGGLADWVDSNDKRKGVIARAYLASSRVMAETVSVDTMSPPPDAGLKFIPPKSWKNPTLPRIHVDALLQATEGWDWSREQISA